MTTDQLHPFTTISLEELRSRVGQEIATSAWIAITQDRIRAFAEITGDHQWIHLDQQRAARESPYGSTIAHGFLTLSMVSQLFSSSIRISGARMTINYGLNRVRFPAAVPANSLIRATFSVQSFKDVSEANEVTFAVVVECENVEKPCCVAEWILRYYR
jgi:acyl dehydratase